jgi:hypothetical protein
MMKVYCAKRMTGVPGRQLVAEAKRNKIILEKHGITVLDPVLAEKVKRTYRPLHNGFSTLKKYWFRDKALIQEAHAILDCTPQFNSEGVKHEIGYARYFLWKPVVRIYPDLGPSVARIEDDFIAGSLDEAADMMNEKWGTWWKRFKWRLLLVNRCLPKFLWLQLKEWVH